MTKLYLPVIQNFGELEISALTPAHTEELAAEQVILQHLHGSIIEDTHGHAEKMEPWHLRFLAAFRLKDYEGAWNIANTTSAEVTDRTSNLEYHLQAHCQTIQIEVPA